MPDLSFDITPGPGGGLTFTITGRLSTDETAELIAAAALGFRTTQTAALDSITDNTGTDEEEVDDGDDMAAFEHAMASTNGDGEHPYYVTGTTHRALLNLSPETIQGLDVDLVRQGPGTRAVFKNMTAGDLDALIESLGIISNRAGLASSTATAVRKDRARLVNTRHAMAR